MPSAWNSFHKQGKWHKERKAQRVTRDWPAATQPHSHPSALRPHPGLTLLARPVDSERPASPEKKRGPSKCRSHVLVGSGGREKRGLLLQFPSWGAPPPAQTHTMGHPQTRRGVQKPSSRTRNRWLLHSVCSTCLPPAFPRPLGHRHCDCHSVPSARRRPGRQQA